MPRAAPTSPPSTTSIETSSLGAGEPETIDTDLLIVGMSTGGMIAMCNAAETIMSLNGDKRVSVLAIDKAGKYGGRSALTHEAQSVNPKRYIETHNNGEPFIDPAAYKKMWIESVTDAEGNVRAKEDVIDMFIEKSGDTIDWLVEHGWHYGTMHSVGCGRRPAGVQYRPLLQHRHGHL